MKQVIQIKYNIDVDKLKESSKIFSKDNRLILKSQQRFNSEANHVLTEKFNKLALSFNGNKQIQTTDCKQTYLYETIKDIKSNLTKIPPI